MRTGALEALTLQLGRHARSSAARLLFLLALVETPASAFMNNTPVVVMMVPVVVSLSRQFRLPSSKFLLPVSYFAILGGTMSLLGTSTNILVDDLYRKAGGPGFGLFLHGAVRRHLCCRRRDLHDFRRPTPSAKSLTIGKPAERPPTCHLHHRDSWCPRKASSSTCDRQKCLTGLPWPPRSATAIEPTAPTAAGATPRRFPAGWRNQRLEAFNCLRSFATNAFIRATNSPLSAWPSTTCCWFPAPPKTFSCFNRTTRPRWLPSSAMTSGHRSSVWRNASSRPWLCPDQISWVAELAD